MVFESETVLKAPLNEVWRFFSDPRNLARITPPSLRFRIVDAPDRSLRRDDRVVYRIRILGIPMTWVTRITDWDEERMFADAQEKGPYRTWVHTHTFERLDDGVRMRDRVHYELPLGFAGRVAGGWFVRRQVRTIFAFRERTIQGIFDTSE